MERMRRLGILTAAALAAAVALTVAPAFAAPPTERTVTAPAEPGMAYDVHGVTRSPAPPGRKAKVVV
jgi:hypothetical protein